MSAKGGVTLSLVLAARSERGAYYRPCRRPGGVKKKSANLW